MFTDNVFYRVYVKRVKSGVSHCQSRHNVMPYLKGGCDTEGVSGLIEYLHGLFSSISTCPVTLHLSRFNNVKSRAGIAFQKRQIGRPEVPLACTERRGPQERSDLGLINMGYPLGSGLNDRKSFLAC